MRPTGMGICSVWREAERRRIWFFTVFSGMGWVAERQGRQRSGRHPHFKGLIWLDSVGFGAIRLEGQGTAPPDPDFISLSPIEHNAPGDNPN